MTDYVRPDLTLVGDEHVWQYLATDGEVGHEWNGVTCLILTTRGRRTGKLRSRPLIYGSDSAAYVVVASYGGAPEDPGWYLDLLANPQAEVQVGPDRFTVVARSAEGPDRERLRKLMADLWPNYNEYTKRTDRRIPVVILERDGT